MNTPATAQEPLYPQGGFSGPRFFISIDTFNSLLSQKLDIEDYSDPNLISFSLDFTDMPFYLVFRAQENWQTLFVYSRDEYHFSHTKPGCEAGRHVVSHAEVKENKARIKSIGDDLVYFFLACLQINKMIRKKGRESQILAMDNEREGLLISGTTGKIRMKIVSGDSLPSLLCTRLFKNAVQTRPYKADDPEGFRLFQADISRRIAEAEEGSVPAMKQLISMYATGSEGTEEDPAQAFFWINRLAQSGDADSQYGLALLYAKGMGTPRDLSKAVYWMGQAAQNGDADAVKAVPKLEYAAEVKERAEKGDIPAQLDYAAFLKGIGGKIGHKGEDTDLKESHEWIEKAAESGDADAIWLAASDYESGSGVGKNETKAISYYMRGAALGHPASLNNAGMYCLRGAVRGRSKEEGFSMVRQAAELGYSEAIKNLGLCYHFGEGTSPDKKLAIMYYEQYLEYNQDPDLERMVREMRSSMK